MCSSCIYHVQNLWRIRRHFDLDSSKLLANALVSSCLDYCISLLSGVAETDLTKLQHILNCMAGVVTKLPPFTRRVPLLHSLHWLPVKYIGPFQNLLDDLQGLFPRNSLFTFAPWSLLLFHHTHWDQADESVCRSLGSTPTQVQGPSALAPLLFGTAFHYLCVQPPRLPPSEDVTKHTFLTWPPPPSIDTDVPNSLLMSQNSLNNFVF